MENPICHRDVVHPADNEIVRWSEQLRKWWLVYPGQSWHHQYSRKKVLFLCRCWKYINYSFYIDITNSWRSRKFLADVQQKKRKIFFIIILIVLALWTLVLPIFFWFTTSNGSCRIESLISQMDFTFPSTPNIFEINSGIAICCAIELSRIMKVSESLALALSI